RRDVLGCGDGATAGRRNDPSIAKLGGSWQRHAELHAREAHSADEDHRVSGDSRARRHRAESWTSTGGHTVNRRHNAKFWLLMTALGFVGGSCLVGFQFSNLNADKARVDDLRTQ